MNHEIGPQGSDYPSPPPGMNGPAEPYKETHPIFDIYKDSPVKFRFHILGLPHVATNETHITCAYTQKLVKFMKMYKDSNHEILHYGNEGSVVPPNVKHIQIFTEEERQRWFKPGPVDTSTGDLVWDHNQMYWRVWGFKAAAELIQNCQKGDFILTVAAQGCYKNVIDQFPGCCRYGTDNVYFLDIGSGHTGRDTDWVAYESSAWRELMHGRMGSEREVYGDAVIPNYFDINDFRFGPNPNEPDARIREIQKEPYYLYMGRIIPLKGWDIAVEACKHLGVKLVLCGQGDPGELPKNVIHFGMADKEQRKSLMAGAIALFVPTKYRGPFEGVNVEAQLSGTPAIVSDNCCFTELVDDRFRCVTLREYIEAAKYAASMSRSERHDIRVHAQSKYSLEAIKPLYDRWFHRLWLLRHAGWPELRSWEELNG